MFITDMVRKATGASYPAVSDRIVMESLIPLPPLAEQRWIAAILDQAETLRTKRRHALAQLDTLTQSLFLDLFGDLESNPKSFPVSALGDAIQLRGGFAFRSSDYASQGIPLVRIGEVNRGGVTLETANFLPSEYEITYSRFIVRPGAMLMSLTGTTGKDDYGNVILLNAECDRYFLNQRVAWLEPNSGILAKHYLLHALCNPKIKAQLTSKSRGIRQANISNGDILELQIPSSPRRCQQWSD